MSEKSANYSNANRPTDPWCFWDFAAYTLRHCSFFRLKVTSVQLADELEQHIYNFIAYQKSVGKPTMSFKTLEKWWYTGAIITGFDDVLKVPAAAMKLEEGYDPHKVVDEVAGQLRTELGLTLLQKLQEHINTAQTPTELRRLTDGYEKVSRQLNKNGSGGRPEPQNEKQALEEIGRLVDKFPGVIPQLKAALEQVDDEGGSDEV